MNSDVEMTIDTTTVFDDDESKQREGGMRMEITDQDKQEAQEAYEAALMKHEENKKLGKR